MPALGHLSETACSRVFRPLSSRARVNPSTPNICWPNTHFVWQAASLCPMVRRRGQMMLPRCLPSWPAGQNEWA